MPGPSAVGTLLCNNNYVKHETSMIEFNIFKKRVYGRKKTYVKAGENEYSCGNLDQSLIATHWQLPVEYSLYTRIAW